MKKFQFTLFSEKYKPVACVVEATGRIDFVMKKAPYKKAMERILAKRNWSTKDLKNYGYNTWKVREVIE